MPAAGGLSDPLGPGAGKQPLIERNSLNLDLPSLTRATDPPPLKWSGCNASLAAVFAPAGAWPSERVEGAPGGIGPFRIRTETDEVVGNLGAGVDFIGRRSGALRLFYEGSFGDLVEEHAAGVKGSLPF